MSTHSFCFSNVAKNLICHPVIKIEPGSSYSLLFILFCCPSAIMTAHWRIAAKYCDKQCHWQIEVRTRNYVNYGYRFSALRWTPLTIILRNHHLKSFLEIRTGYMAPRHLVRGVCGPGLWLAGLGRAGVWLVHRLAGHQASRLETALVFSVGRTLTPWHLTSPHSCLCDFLS